MKTTFVILLVSVCISANSQNVTLKATLDTSRILIGDQVKLRINVDQPKNAKLLFPEFGDTLTGKIQVLKSFPADTIKKANAYHIRKEYLITSFDSGRNEIVPIAFPFEIGKTKDTLHSLPLQLTVLSLPVDTTKEFRDIKAPLHTPISFREMLPYIGGGLLILLIAVGIYYLFVLRKKGEVFGSKKIIEPAHIIALRELDNLRTEKLWQNGKEKLYYTKLTEIIRVYIENRFGIAALEMTSDEIINALNLLIIEEKASVELLKNMFFTADLVKFAKASPLPNENEIGLLDAYQFVNNTKLMVSTVNETTELTKE